MKLLNLRFASRSAGNAALPVAAALMSVFVGSGIAQAQSQGVYRDVRIDLSGLPPGATQARRDLGACLSQNIPLALSGRLGGGRNAPVLVVRPTSVWFAPMTGTRNGFREGGFESYSVDQFDGEVIAGGRVIPITVVAAPPDMGGVGAPVANANHRLNLLCQSFAFAVARRT